MSKNDFDQAFALIRKLPNKPNIMNSTDDPIVFPELYVKKVDNKWRTYLADSIISRINIDQKYKRILANCKKHPSYLALQQELQAAQWLIKGLNRRNETLLRVSQYIINYQVGFLNEGKYLLRPMNISQVAHDLDLHESSISRITSGKYIATPHGVFELKYFFPSGVSTNSGEGCSIVAIQEIIKSLIANEKISNVVSDADIMLYLNAQGIHIARRTVAKYREALNILPSHIRKQNLLRIHKQTTMDMEEELYDFA